MQGALFLLYVIGNVYDGANDPERYAEVEEANSKGITEEEKKRSAYSG